MTEKIILLKREGTRCGDGAVQEGSGCLLSRHETGVESGGLRSKVIVGLNRDVGTKSRKLSSGVTFSVPTNGGGRFQGDEGVSDKGGKGRIEENNQKSEAA